jgi:hypothetical protein
VERERTEQTNTNEAVRLWLDCSKDHLRKLRDQVVSMYDTLLPHKPPDQLYLIFPFFREIGPTGWKKSLKAEILFRIDGCCRNSSARPQKASNRNKSGILSSNWQVGF